LLKLGVTTIVDTTGEVPEFTAVKEAMFPVPAAGSPIVVLLFVQLYVVAPPVFTVLKIIGIVFPPLKYTGLRGWFTWAVGLTNTV
jgi:hypothetical protein